MLQHCDEAQIEHEVGAAVPIETLGKDIIARIEAGDKAKSSSDDHYKSAGLQLIEARDRVADFQAFLKEHCPNLSRSRAYELIEIAGGKAEEVRAKNRGRTQRHRAKAAKAKTETVAKAKTEPVSVTQRTHPSDWYLDQFKGAVDDYMPKMNADDKRQALAYVQKRAS